MDSITNNEAKDVCSECGEYSDPQISTTPPPTTSSPTLSPNVSSLPIISRRPTSSPTIRILCIGVRNKIMIYHRDYSYYFDSDLQWCSIDTDRITNNYAKDVYSECGECSDP